MKERNRKIIIKQNTTRNETNKKKRIKLLNAKQNHNK
jgi:hypothetical protein